MQTTMLDDAVFRTLVEICGEGLIVVSPDWHVKYINAAYSRIFGYTAETLPNGDTFSIVHPDDKEKLQSRTQDMLKGIHTGEPLEFRAFHQDGSLRYIEGWGKVLHSGDIVGFLHDISSRKMTEMALRESEANARSLFELSEDGVAIFAPTGEFTYISPSFTRVFGYSLEDLSGLSTFSMLHPDDVQEATLPMYDLLEGRKERIKTEYRMRHKNGSYRYCEGVGRLLPDGSIVAYVRDISERIASQRAIEASETKFRTLVETSEDGIVIISEAGVVSYVSPGFTKLFGYTRDDYKNVNSLNFVHPEDVQTTVEALQALFSHQQETVRTKYRLQHKDGNYRYCEGAARLLPDGNVVGFISDVTERILSQKALEESETKFRTLIETSAAGIATYTQTGQITYVSPTFTALFGYDKRDVEALTALDFVHPQFVAEGQRQLGLLFSGQIAQAQMQYPLQCKDGNYRYVDGFARLLPDGTVVAYLADIHERIVAQKALEESQAALIQLNAELEQRIEERTAELAATLKEQRQLAAIIEATTDYVGIADLEGFSLYVNQHGRQMVGKTDEDFLSRWNVARCHPEREQANLSAIITEAAQGRAGSGETVLLHKSGREIPVSMVAVPLKSPEGKVEAMAAIMRDISEQKRVADELQRAKEAAETALSEQKRLIKIIEATSDLVAMVAPSGHGIYLNRAGREMLGVGLDEDISQLNMMAHYPPQVLQQILEVHIPQSIANGGAWTGENLILHRSGKEIPISQAGLAIFNENGEPEYLATIARDISERKRVEKELQEAKESAEAANRAKSTFLANMSHEIRTPMNAIIGMTSLLLDTPLQAKQADFVETIRTSGDTLLTIINDILDFSKIEAEKLELVYRPLNIRECLESALDLLAPMAAEKHIDLAYVMDENVPPAIVGDVTRLRQILVNLLSNAVKFTAQGEVVVTVSSIPRKGKVTELHFAVRDTGMGIPADKMNRLFKAFSQVDASMTREFGGTGLGLAISKRLSEMMGGTTWAESEGIAGRGSTFHFTIVAETAKSPVKSFLQSKQPQLKDKHVLIVDDNATNRRILSLQSQTWGMHSHAAALPSEALDLLKTMRFDVAILDMHMPEMDGEHLGREIRKTPEGRELPLIMLTSAMQNGDSETFAAMLTKPVKPSELYNVLMSLFISAEDSLMTSQDTKAVNEETTVLADILPLHILLAEDVLVNQKFAVHALERMGYRVDVVANGQEAFDAVMRQSYDLVLMDVQMPLMDGLEATRQIRRRNIPQPQIIAMTANAMQGDREICLEAGMDDYISKPVYLQELRAALERAGGRMFQTIEEQAADQENLNIAEILEMGRDLLEAFIEEIPQNITELHAAFEAKEGRLIAEAAHKIKGSSAYIGASKAKELAGTIERLGTTGDIHGAVVLLRQMEIELETTIANLKRALEG
jgi:PAS domain S-box-containing protein